MFQWFARVTTSSMIAVILLILGAIFWGKQFDRFPALYIQHGISSNNTEHSILDFDTGVHYYIDYTNSYYQSPNGLWEIRNEWIDGQIHIYLRSAQRLNFRLLGMYDVPNLPQLQWASDSQSLLLIYKPIGENIVIEQIDIETGVAYVLNTYEFSGSVRFAYLLDEEFLVVMGNLNSLIINLQTDELVRLDDTYIVAPPSNEGHYIAYGNTGNAGGISPEESNLHILDLETLETRSFVAEDFGGAILGNLQWSLTGTVLPIADINNNIILYNAETQTHERLSTEYEMYPNSGAWSYDGTRMIVVKRLNDEEIAFIILNLETGDEVQLLTLNNRVSSTPNLYAYYSQQLLWTDDNRYILSSNSQGMSRLIFDIHDAETGEIVYSMDERLDFSLSNSYISWWRNR